MTTPAGPREAWDRLVTDRVTALLDAAPYSGNPDDIYGAADASAAMQEAEMLEDAARAFADAVDASGKGLAYEDAVLLTGTAGPVIVSEVEWRATPGFWETVAAAGHGRLDSITDGAALTRYLHTGDARIP